MYFVSMVTPVGLESVQALRRHRSAVRLYVNPLWGAWITDIVNRLIRTSNHNVPFSQGRPQGLLVLEHDSWVFKLKIKSVDGI